MSRISRAVAVGLLAVLALSIAAAGETIVVVMGDSTMLSGSSKPGEKLTDRLQFHLDQAAGAGKYKVINAGVGGEKAEGGLRRIEQVLGNKPDVLTVSYGLNDTGSCTSETFEKSLRGLIEAVQKKSKTRIVLLTSTPFDNNKHAWRGQDKYKDAGLDAWMNKNILDVTRKLSAELKLPLCDLHEHFWKAIKDKTPIEELIVPDGVHLSAKGNDLAGKRLSEVVLGRTGAEKPANPRSLSWKPSAAPEWKTIFSLDSQVQAAKKEGKPLAVFVHRPSEAAIMTDALLKETKAACAVVQVPREAYEAAAAANSPNPDIKCLRKLMPEALPDAPFAIVVRPDGGGKGEAVALEGDDLAAAWKQKVVEAAAKK